MRTPQETAFMVSRMLSETLNLTVMMKGADQHWELHYLCPGCDKEFPPITIDGEGMKIPRGSSQLVADLILAAVGRDGSTSTPQTVH